MNKTAKIIIITEITVIFTLVILKIVIQNNKIFYNSQEISPTPSSFIYYSQYDSRITMGKDVSAEKIPSQTGAVINGDYYSLQEKNFGKLLDSLPIKTDKFEMVTDRTDFFNIKVAVSILPPHEENQKSFNLWLSENGYGGLDNKYFNIINK